VVYNINSFVKTRSIGSSIEEPIFYLMPVTLLLASSCIAYKTVDNNKNSIPKRLSNLSILPLVVVGATGLVLEIGDNLFGEGAWFIFFCIVFFGICISLFLIIVATIVSSIGRRKNIIC
jgi:hypothetical protein